MSLARPVSLFAAFGLFFAPLPGADAFGPPPKPLIQQSAEAKLLGEFARFAALSDGSVGIGVRDLQTGETQALNGDTLFTSDLVSQLLRTAASSRWSMRGRRAWTNSLRSTPPWRARAVSPGCSPAQAPPCRSTGCWN